MSKTFSRRFRFRLVTLMLLTAAIAAACASWLKRDAWYIAKTIPIGYHDCRVAVSADREFLACLEGGSPNLLSVFRLETGELIEEESIGALGIWYLTYADDGRLLGFNWHRLVQFDPLADTSEELLSTPSGPPTVEQIVAVSPDGKSVLIAATESVRRRGAGSAKPANVTATYRIRDVQTHRVVWELPTSDLHSSLAAFSADSRRVALQSGGETQIWDYRRNKLLHRLPLEYTPSWPPVLFDDGRRIFAQSTIWDAETGRQLARLNFGTGHAALVNDSFLVAEDGGNVRYWRQRRREGSWSPIDFPEPWLAGVLGLLSLASAIRHSWPGSGHAGHAKKAPSLK